MVNVSQNLLQGLVLIIFLIMRNKIDKLVKIIFDARKSNVKLKNAITKFNERKKFYVLYVVTKN